MSLEPRLISDVSYKDQTRQSCKFTPTDTYSRNIRFNHYYTVVLCAPGFKVPIYSSSPVKFCFLRVIWFIMSAEKTYSEVVSGDENPDDNRNWMRAYQQESEEDALDKAIKLSKV